MSDTGNSMWREERGSAQSSANDTMDSRHQEGDVQCSGTWNPDITGDAPVCQRSRLQRSSCFHLNFGGRKRQQKQVKSAVQGPTEEAGRQEGQPWCDIKTSLCTEYVSLYILRCLICLYVSGE